MERGGVFGVIRVAWADGIGSYPVSGGGVEEKEGQGFKNNKIRP